MRRTLSRVLFPGALMVTAAMAGLAAQQPQPAAPPTTPQPARAAAPAPAGLRVLPVQGNVHVIMGSGGNVLVQTGDNGVVLVDTPALAMVPQVMAEIRKLSTRPIRYIINTSISAESVGGNEALVGPAAARGTGGAPFGFAGLARPGIIAHENVLNRMSASTPPTPAAAQPTTTYYLPSMDMFNNGESIVISHAPAAHTDADSLVYFRRSDVIATGAVYTPGRYPEIDVQRGGSVAGMVTALGNILAIAVPEAFEEGGTKIVPSRGRISEETDVAEFRDMIAIIRDRVQDGIKTKKTLDQIKASKPSRDYDAEYGASPADADRFVESIYRSLVAASAPAAGGRRS